MRHTLRLVVVALLGTLLTAGGTTAAVPAPEPAAPSPGAADIVKEERKVIALTNKQRAAHGCGPLRYKKSLRTAARRHTNRMAEAGDLSHQLPGEPSLGRRVTNAGYKGWTMVAENIAVGYPTPRAVVRGWMRSEGHRANILNCRLRHIGVGLVRDDGVAWWTQVFGRK